ncbi:hypothetical protein [Nostoc sp. NIES-3756]|uniref:hypothetical protein n=1 Tax=Nostoc sp. NIES-3756 TaxID=1751286 RepID=UPI00082C9D9E|nr:hypothetical protein [Nostoc sp. NIES-3756]
MAFGRYQNKKATSGCPNDLMGFSFQSSDELWLLTQRLFSYELFGSSIPLILVPLLVVVNRVVVAFL